MAVSSNPLSCNWNQLKIAWKRCFRVFSVCCVVLSGLLPSAKVSCMHNYFLHTSQRLCCLFLHRHTAYGLTDATKWFAPCSFKYSVCWNVLGCLLLCNIFYCTRSRLKNRLSTILESQQKTALHLNRMKISITQYSRNKRFFLIISSP